MDFLLKKQVFLHCICFKSVHLRYHQWSGFGYCFTIDERNFHGSYFYGTNFHEFLSTKFNSIGFKCLRGFFSNRNDIWGNLIDETYFQEISYSNFLLSPMNLPSTDFVLKGFELVKNFSWFSQLVHENAFEFLLMELIFTASSRIKWVSNDLNGFPNNRVQFYSFPMKKFNLDGLPSLKSISIGFQSTLLVFLKLKFLLRIGCLHGVSFAWNGLPWSVSLQNTFPGFFFPKIS